jgi:hypothetical protein
MPSILSKLTTLLWPFPNKSPTTTTTLTVLTPPLLLSILLPIYLPRLSTSYKTYLSLGPGGIPHNPLGYLIQAALRPIARSDLRAHSPPPYPNNGVEKYAPHGQTSFLLHLTDDDDELPERSPPPRPDVPYFVAPQRQVTQSAPEGMVARMEGFMRGLVGASEGVLQVKASGLEGVGTAAVWLGEGVAVPGFMGMAKGEVAHVHCGEGSAHVTLSLVDAERAVGKGW